MSSTSYPSGMDDWKGLFIRHLADALARRPDIRLGLWAPPGETHPKVSPAATARESRWLAQLMLDGGVAHAIRSGGARALTTPATLLWFLHRAYRRQTDLDLYHVNWLQNALPLPANGKPLLVSVLGTDMELLRKPLMRSLLRRVFRHRRTMICPNAEWMVAPLETLFGDLADVRFVPFGIDPVWFGIERPPLAGNAHQWIVVSRLTRAKLGSLFEWCAPLFEGRERELHLFGPRQEAVQVPPWIRYHGPASPEALSRDWFPNAAGLITLSRHAEGRPQVMLEAMAAGLPILASRLPAHENIVRHGKTGWLCDGPEDVAQGVGQFEEAELNRQAGRAARDWAAAEIGTWDDCAQRYASLYARLMKASRDD
ncbi:MAG: glycosyltransferase family 4 protein [Candidatus Nitricoxidivorans perseverans]|uniref:Glycosyltransferase family 4 protein n=1 Tax=Candidatus Nitricoxidivorans perseverans TaxID=2975601 RepID=A0AA49IWF9_9PROT|nr:MAG: glycosyltransferase family 4 protein [Candidatus Nitricoxidivorans perseverans]